MPNTKNHEIVIIGGGTAGLTVAAQLRRAAPKADVAVIEPSERHYYQPLWTLVGGGVVPIEKTVRPERDYIPDGVTWIRDSVESVHPEANRLTLSDGSAVDYAFLVVAPGIELNWAGIEGLPAALGSGGVCSNYSPDLAPYTWETLRGLSRGSRLIFTQPSTPVKCGGAPQKIMYLAADHLRRTGKLDSASIIFKSPGSVVFGVKEFERTLKKVIARYGIDFQLGKELVAIDGAAARARFRVTHPESGETTFEEERFDMLHVVPPQRAPAFVREGPLANADGWLDVDRSTLRHARFDNIFGLGDAAGTPNAKTGAAVRKQAPVVVGNLLAQRKSGETRTAMEYSGYSSCPLVTGYGRLVLAEFDYDNRPDPSFPFDTTKERRSMYLLKRYVLPGLYWHGMLRGRA